MKYHRPKLRTLLLDLYGKFTSRSKYQCNWTISRSKEGLPESRSCQIASRMLRHTHELMCNIAGSAKEIVFPDPVWAMATTSRPLSAIGHAWHWIGVGSEKPCAWIVVIRYSGKPASSKEVTGRGTPRP